MTCEAEEQAVAELRRHKLEAASQVQREMTVAEVDIAYSNARIYDWGSVRLAQAIMRCWEVQHTQAEAALARCKERERQKGETTV